MPEMRSFHTGTALAHGLQDLLLQLGQRLHLQRPIRAYLAGGMAVHLYTANRVTTTEVSGDERN